MPNDIFEYITQQEIAYSLPIQVVDGWEWNMKEHVRLSTLYKYSQFATGNSAKDRDDKPFKNIVRPILNLQYRTEGFDVKDIVLYIDDTKAYFKSFLVKKYHNRWANENEIDSFIDEMVESFCDYGGALIKDVNDVKPEVVPLYSIAFCDQTNMLSAPLAIKHFYSPDELQDMAAKGWGNTANGATVTIDEAIILAQQYKVPDKQNGEQVKTPGKYVEVYEVQGVMPESWLPSQGDPDKYTRQMQIVLYYHDKDGKKQGVKLFAGKRKKKIFKQILRDKIHGRALGFGGVEELIDSQVWSNYNEIHIKGMLDAAAKVVFKTTDAAFKQRNKMDDIDHNEILVLDDGKDIAQLDMVPRSFELFEKKVSEWQAHAQLIGGATDALLGDTPPDGTPFALQQLITSQGTGLHEYRRGKLATFTGTVWREWVIPWLVRDISQGKKFLAELTLDEMQQIAESLVTCQVNDIIIEKILSGENPDPNDMEQVKQGIRTQFMKGGKKKFLEIFKEEMSEAPIEVQIDVAGKQKNLAKITDAITNIIRQIIAAPQILDDPRMAQMFNEILEYSGLSPLDFGMGGAPKAPQPTQTQTPTPTPAAVPTPAMA